MPQMGYDMKEGTIVRWLKREGDEVKRGEVVAEIETDKAVVEMEAYDSGILRKVVVPEGMAVPVGQVIGIIGALDETLPEVTIAAGPTPTMPAEAKPAAAPEPAAPSSAEIKASPLARRLADEKGVDIRKVPGTGPGGRITKEDVQAYEAGFQKEAPATPPLAEAEPAKAEPEHAPTAEIVSLTRMRQAIAKLTTRSKAEIPHFYVASDIDVTEAMRLRQELNKALDKEGVRISVNDMIVKAAANALKKHPSFNAFFEGDHLRLNREINIGIAVALDEGLIVPAILGCGNKSLTEIAQASRDLVERAKGGILHPDEYTKGTFGISNLGMFDVDSFVAIIHPPNAGVLAVGAIRQQPVVRSGEVAIAQVMKATLSVDHRVADGAQAARFLAEIKRLLENPVGLLV